MWRTHGPYVHVEVDVGNGKSVAALTHGIVLHDAPTGDRVVAVPTSAKLTNPQRLKLAILFAKYHVGKEYGWLDIINQAWSILFPYGPFLVRSDHLDCSDLTASFLWIAGYPLPSRDIVTSLVSPNDIARSLSVDFPELKLLG